MASPDRGSILPSTNGKPAKQLASIKKAETQRQELLGQKRQPRDRRDLVSSATQISLLADMAPTEQSDSPPLLVFPQPYPPSTAKLQDLRFISLESLRIATHHKGSVLRLHRVGPVITNKEFSWTVVEDGTGEVERLEVYLHHDNLGTDVLESCNRYLVKEPLFTLNIQGEACIRINHPSDLISINKDMEIESLGSDNNHDADKCKQFGNQALKESSLLGAYQHYTRGIEAIAAVDPRPAIATDLYRNRSHLNLLLHRYDEALSDALASLISVGNGDHALLDSKAYLRAGLACYRLGNYTQAEHYLATSLAMSPDSPFARETKARLRASLARLDEQTTGDLDLPAIRSRLSASRPTVEAATFSDKVMVQPSKLGGNGLFLSQGVPAGGIVLVEKAFHLSHAGNGAWTALFTFPSDEEIRAVPAGMIQGVMTKLRNNPSLAPKVLGLYSSYSGLGPVPIFDELGDLVVDAFQIADIVGKNAFASTTSLSASEDSRTAATGLWTIASQANHSCLPNVKREMLGDLLVLTALEDLDEGGEVLHPYVQGGLEEREAELDRTWGVKCTCRLCEAERADGEEVRRKRKEVAEKAERLVRSSGGSKKAVLKRMKGMVKDLQCLYDWEIWKDLPRNDLERIQEWLVSVTGKRG
ncbi:hypothetical protein KVT40_006279 [Elsinoe batatas]|uniref:SET domain-containing protein n=1 Tax=Elsinoe batatas TaxID=2601811 RepID=A0A8K0L0B6_9PEZI|nr:hypothetical protein KVT40_006279 [Elsinoe batatas]